MARAKVVHSDDAVMVEFKGDPKNPEPSTAVIKFPGGHVEVSRTSDGQYWAHLEVVGPVNITDSRIDYDYNGWVMSMGVPELPMAEHVKKIAIKVANTDKHFDPDSSL